MRASQAVPAPRLLRNLHETVLDRWPGDHLVSTLPNGERVRVAARHRGLCWNPDRYRAFHESVRAGAVVFDVGANLGAYTLLFAQWVGPAGRVFAFEPSPPSLAGLQRHLVLNALDDRVEVVPAAVCDRIRHRDISSSSTRRGERPLHQHGRRVHGCRDDSIDQFCADRRLTPDVLKIDVEGAELEVLRGARQTLTSPTVTAFVEFHPSIWVERGFTVTDVARELHAMGFVAQPLDPGFDVWTMEGVCARLVRR